MENEEVNEYLTEKMELCWHEWEEVGSYWSENCGGPAIDYECKHCENVFIEEVCESTKDEILKSNNHDFFSPEGFFILWNWAVKQDWWVKFKDSFNHIGVFSVKTCIEDRLINPEAFAKAIYNYLKESE